MCRFSWRSWWTIFRIFFTLTKYVFCVWVTRMFWQVSLTDTGRGLAKKTLRNQPILKRIFKNRAEIAVSAVRLNWHVNLRSVLDAHVPIRRIHPRAFVRLPTASCTQCHLPHFPCGREGHPEPLKKRLTSAAARTCVTVFIVYNKYSEQNVEWFEWIDT